MEFQRKMAFFSKQVKVVLVIVLLREFNAWKTGKPGFFFRLDAIGDATKMIESLVTRFWCDPFEKLVSHQLSVRKLI